MSTKAKLIKIVLPLLILAAGVGLMWFMIAIRPEPQREERKDPGALVEVLTVTRGEHQVHVSGTGTVQPQQEINLTPQVDGRVTDIAAEFIAGGFFSKGEELFRIEDTDYRLTVKRARAAQAKAEYDLAAMKGHARIARQEWNRLQLDNGDEPNPLVLYEPQLKNARAALLAAQASLQQAELDLQRTVLRAPFNAVILSESVDTGQYVRSGNGVAMLAGTDRAEIVVPLPLEELGWLQIPRSGTAGPGSEVEVQLTAGDATFRWVGQVVRRLGDVDPEGRMVRLVVAVEDPYGLRQAVGKRPELAMGTFVQVVLKGALLKDVTVLPAAALRDGGSVWLMNDGTLKIRSVKVVRRTRNEVVVSGLVPGEQVVLTNLAGTAAGMKLRALSEAAEQDASTVQEGR